MCQVGVGPPSVKLAGVLFKVALLQRPSSLLLLDEGPWAQCQGCIRPYKAAVPTHHMCPALCQGRVCLPSCWGAEDLYKATVPKMHVPCLS